jgi:hypothetical protein
LSQVRTTTYSQPLATQDNEPRVSAILLDWSPGIRGTRRGFAKVKMSAMTIPDIPVCVSHSKAWASIPGKAVVRDGQQLVDDTGKLRWTPCFELSTQARNAFSRVVVGAVLSEYPNALDDPS